MRLYEVIVVGAGPAGMAAAYGAGQNGVNDILMIERQEESGGVLRQCIHDGFGISIYEKSYTGPEYAEIWKENICDKAEIKHNTAVLTVEKCTEGYRVICIGGTKGREAYHGKAVIFATGCRERTVGQLRIPGSRPAGIYTAGCAQYMMNVRNLKPGNTVAIFGTGDIGLIMARRLSLEGISVKLIFGDRASGLARNYIQCVRDFGIPLKLGYTLVSVHGYKRLKGISIAPLDHAGNPDLAKRQYIPCDTLLTAVGLIPETEAFRDLKAELSEDQGIAADANGKTDLPGIFACGNVTRIYDLVDSVTLSGIHAGKSAAAYLGYHADHEEKDKAEKAFQNRRECTFEGLEGLSESETVCIACPKGCLIRTEEINGDLFITGNHCVRGREYALSERKAPKRILTTTMKVKGREDVLIPVRTEKPIPKEKLREAVKALNQMELTLPVKKGDLIVENLLGTGVNVIGSKNMEVIDEA